MKKLIILLALSLPLMAQEAEAKETVGKKVVRIVQDAEWSKSKSAHQRDHNKNGSGKMKRMNRSDEHKMMGKRMAMAKRKKMQKKRAIRSFVRIIVIGGIAYYVGYHQGEKHYKDGWDKKPPMGDRK
ncbi:hypothetical protein HOE22_06085 [Candidatus Woesearchaeota archaeon]|nr:hypothetical protein [Candidatus Woesearchaeota archaeon]MBT7555815.1 hypothetical protein [Candidatus Woesearchaeota archaeon]